MDEEQIGLFDMNLKTTDQITDFKDTDTENLEKLEWHSEPCQTFYYDNDDMKLTLVTLDLKGKRVVKKDGRFKFILQRYYHYSGLEECIADEQDFKEISQLADAFENEKADFESTRNLPKDVLFDGRRYCFKFEVIDGKVEFTEKWFGDDSNE